MKIKQSLFIPAVLLFSFCAFSNAFAQEILPSTTEVILLPNPRNKPVRPKVPSRQHIICFYEEGMLTFEFAIPEGECIVEITETATNRTRSYRIDSELPEPSVFVGPLGEAIIVVSTATGHEYEGLLTF